MVHRPKFEVEFGVLFDKYKMGSTVWSPLAGGLLTGKYLSENAEGRFNNEQNNQKNSHYDEYLHPSKVEKTRELFKGLEEIAKSLGGTMAQLALAWVLKNKDVSAALCGFSKVSQVEVNIKALDMVKKLTPEIEEKIEKLLGNRPETGKNYKSLAPFPSRR